MPEENKIVNENKIENTGATVGSPEKITPVKEQVDQSFEKVASINDETKQEQGIHEGNEGEFGKVTPTGTTNIVQSEELKKIEDILSEGIESFYKQMPDKKKKEFRQVGEITALKIDKITREANFKVKKVLDLIKKWLSMIPGANKFFIEQEAKIKTDKIVNKTHNF